jgi:hypothetical protein
MKKYLCFEALQKFRYSTPSFPIQTWLRQDLDDGLGAIPQTTPTFPLGAFAKGLPPL